MACVVPLIASALFELFACALGLYGWRRLLGVLTSGLILGLGSIEAVAMLDGRSDPVRFSLTGARWRADYWHPVNTMGYRDGDWALRKLDSRRVIAVFGDEVVAGIGVEDPRDRFPDTLSQILSQAYEVVNLGREGDSTAEELDRFSSLTLRPVVTILTYSGDDILGVARRMGRSITDPRETPPVAMPLLKVFETRTYLGNYLAAAVARAKMPGFWHDIDAAYTDPAVSEAHIQELKRFSAHAREIGTNLVCVLVPRLDAGGESKTYYDLVRRVMASEVVPVFDVAEYVDKVDPRKRQVSEIDPRPSSVLHVKIGGVVVQFSQSAQFGRVMTALV
jgi:hypothetical protein